MRILLVFPRFKYPSGQPPVGLACLKAYLAERFPSIAVDVFDGTFVKHGFAKFEKILRKSRYDAVCYSVMTTMSDDAHRLADTVKKISPGTKNIFGGPHPTVVPELCLKDTNIDIAVMGEGELTLEELVKNGFNPSGVCGAVFRDPAGGVVRNEPRKPIEDIDSLPEPDRTGFDMDRYINVWNSMDTVSPRLRGTSLVVTRGCPYRCSFCQPTLENLFGKAIRKRSPENVVAELADLKKKYGINACMFEDDTFTMSRVWALEVCDLIMKENLDVRWCCNMRADLCREDMLEIMYSAGLRKINIGIESLTQRLLDDVYNKRITVRQIEDSITVAKKIGLTVQGYFMIGHPTETLEEMKNTIEFAAGSDLDDVSYSIITPFPGTYLYENEKDMIVKNIQEFDYYSECVYDPGRMRVPVKTVKRLKEAAYLKFYLRPGRLLKQLSLLFSHGGIRKLIYKLWRVV
ncbi:MAG: cobalamin-dependent protein [Elusimicrobia bacterium]|nr:cobalamin-dependent protein [Elusimicrobiota bacterium]